MVFIHEDLTEEERQITLAHEEGHIWNDHLIQAGILGNDVIQEYQANEFAHFLLKDKTGKQKWRRIVTILVIFMLLIGTGIGIYIRNQHDKAVYTEDLYRTETGKKYHLRNCMYIKGKKDVYRLTREEFYSRVYEPCEACKPDER